MKKNKFTSAAAAVREVIKTMNKGVIFSGWDLRDGVLKYYPEGRNMYIDTFLREMRESCANDYELLNRADGLYRKITPSRAELHQEELKKYKNIKQLEFNFEGEN